MATAIETQRPRFAFHRCGGSRFAVGEEDVRCVSDGEWTWHRAARAALRSHAVADHVELRSGIYRDSVRLLQISADALDLPGVQRALVAMATPLNLDLLTGLGFLVPAGATPGEGDLLVAVRADDEDAGVAAVAAIDRELARSPAAPAGGSVAGAPRPATLGRAVRAGGAGLAVISVPGPYVVPEAVDALRAGADVFVFSDGVSLEDEAALKRLADGLGRLVMGPDCGTASLAGVGIGFANKVPDGPVGIVAASGTGAQHLACLLAASGVGVRHIIGVGGRDLHAAVGATSTLRAMRLLDADPAVSLIVVLSKPPAPEVAAAVRAAAAGELGTPVRFGLLGDGQPDITALAAEVVAAVGGVVAPPQRWLRPEVLPIPDARVCGLFAGGTLASEAASVLRAAGRGPVGLGALAGLDDGPLPVALARAITTTGADVVVDLGDDLLTAGRPHPMIDPGLRLDLLDELATTRPGVVLVDVVCGIGAHLDPAAGLEPVIRRLVDGGHAVVVTLVGADADPQRPGEVAERLHAAGAQVLASNAEAARLACSLVAPTLEVAR